MLICSVLWNGAHSANFCSINGIKQGSILSPYLFSIFTNDLLLALELNNEGCRVGHEFFGCIAYADDILLLAPLITALRRMLDICTACANFNNILFNPNKSHCLHFGKSANPIKQFPVELQGVMLTWTDHIVNLGHILYPNLDDSCDIDAKQHDFCSQVNYFIARFGHLTPALKIRLFQTYCQSFYGSQIWDLNNNKINTHDTRLLGDYGLCPIAPTVSFSLISCLAKTFLKSLPYASFHLQIAVSLVSTPRSLSLLMLFACHHCIHFVITCILFITRLLTVTL